MAQGNNVSLLTVTDTEKRGILYAKLQEYRNRLTAMQVPINPDDPIDLEKFKREYNYRFNFYKLVILSAVFDAQQPVRFTSVFQQMKEKCSALFNPQEFAHAFSLIGKTYTGFAGLSRPAPEPVEVSSESSTRPERPAVPT